MQHDVVITRRVEFDAGHRICRHGGKCAGLHGHRYVVEATVSGPIQHEGSETGMVIDFASLKRYLEIMAGEFDHATLLWREDPMVPFIIKTDATRHKCLLWDALRNEFGKFILCDKHPTAEGLAAMFAEHLVILLPTNMLKQVRVYETPNCWADWVEGN